MSSLLPPNANPHEYALDDATARLGAVPVDIDKLWDPQTCPAGLLPWLAWALSADEWDDSWSEAQKRAVVAASYAIHSHKGTPYAIRAALATLGYGNARIMEGEIVFHSGLKTHDGSWRHGADGYWPLFDVLLNVGTIPDADMIQKIRGRIDRYKNARSQLRNLIFMNLFHDGLWLHDGTYKHNGGVL